MNLATVGAVVAEHVPYLRVSETTEGDHWLACDRLVSEPATLVATVRATMRGFETDDEVVAASLFAQSYAFRVAGVALAAHALDLPLPNVSAAATAVRVDKPRPSAVAYLDPEVTTMDTAQFVEELVDGHMRALVEAVHREFCVGERLLWGNVAGSCATAYRAVESSGADHERVRERAADFVAAAQEWFAGLGEFTIVDTAGRAGWFWARTNCCLWFRTDHGQLCDNCSLNESLTPR